MITEKSEYKHAQVSRIPVEGKIFPVRNNRTLKAEDASFLAEALYDRASVYLDWPSSGWMPGPPDYISIPGDNISPNDVTDRAFSLTLSQKDRRSCTELAKLFYVVAYTSITGILRRKEFMRYVDPLIEAPTDDKVLDDNERFEDLVREGGWFRDVEHNFLKEIGFDASSFAAKAKNSPMTDWRTRPLDLVAIRDAYSDAKNLRRLIVPCETTSGVVCDWQESTSSQDHDTGRTYSANLVVEPLSRRNANFNFSTLSCFCTTPTDGDLTATLYMSGKSVYYGDDNRSPCCADWMNVTPSGDDISLSPMSRCDSSKLEVERIYILLRAWRWNLDGMEKDTLDAKMYLTSVETTEWGIPASTFSVEKCKECLSKVGFPEECERQHDGETSIRHIAKVGVDVVGIYALAHLKDPPVKTDIWDLELNP